MPIENNHLLPCTDWKRQQNYAQQVLRHCQSLSWRGWCIHGGGKWRQGRAGGGVGRVSARAKNDTLNLSMSGDFVRAYTVNCFVWMQSRKAELCYACVGVYWWPIVFKIQPFTFFPPLCKAATLCKLTVKARFIIHGETLLASSIKTHQCLCCSHQLVIV